MKRFGVGHATGLCLAALWLVLLIGGIALRQAVDWQVQQEFRVCKSGCSPSSACENGVGWLSCSLEDSLRQVLIERRRLKPSVLTFHWQTCRCWIGGRPSSAPAPSSLGAARWAGGGFGALLTTRDACIVLQHPTQPALRQGRGPLCAAIWCRSCPLSGRCFRLCMALVQVVLPMLSSEVVSTGWMSESDFLTGLALIQALPGPLFNLSAYIGVVSAPTVGNPPQCVHAISVKSCTQGCSLGMDGLSRCNPTRFA